MNYVLRTSSCSRRAPFQLGTVQIVDTGQHIVLYCAFELTRIEVVGPTSFSYNVQQSTVGDTRKRFALYGGQEVKIIELEVGS